MTIFKTKSNFIMFIAIGGIITTLLIRDGLPFLMPWKLWAILIALAIAIYGLTSIGKGVIYGEETG